MKKMFFLSIVAVFVLIAGAILVIFFHGSSQPQQVVVSDAVSEILGSQQEGSQNDLDTPPQDSTDTAEPDAINSQPQKVTEIPPQVLISVPFIVQAPNANWEFPYAEACEEASVVMIDAFYKHKQFASQDEMKSAIDGIIYWGDDTFGSYDTNAATTARYFSEKLGFSGDDVSVIYDMTIDDMKAILAKGYPIIVPAAGRELGNKYFQTPGPLYHMLVLVGYDGNEIITNDPGTRRGEGYRYNQNVLFNAIHDLTPNLEDITSGRKVMIVVKGYHPSQP